MYTWEIYGESGWHKYGTPLCKHAAWRPQWSHRNDSAAHHNPTRQQLGQSAFGTDTDRAPLQPRQAARWDTEPSQPYHQLFYTLKRLKAHTSSIVHRHTQCFHILNKTQATLLALGHQSGLAWWIVTHEIPLDRNDTFLFEIFRLMYTAIFETLSECVSIFKHNFFWCPEIKLKHTQICLLTLPNKVFLRIMMR